MVLLLENHILTTLSQGGSLWFGNSGLLKDPWSLEGKWGATSATTLWKLDFHTPPEITAGSRESFLVCFECMNAASACLFLIGLERMSLLCSVYLGYSLEVTFAASHLGSEFISGISGHWNKCSRDSHINWIWIILKLFCTFCFTEDLALEFHDAIFYKGVW